MGNFLRLITRSTRYGAAHSFTLVRSFLYLVADLQTGEDQGEVDHMSWYESEQLASGCH